MIDLIRGDRGRHQLEFVFVSTCIARRVGIWGAGDLEF